MPRAVDLCPRHGLRGQLRDGFQIGTSRLKKARKNGVMSGQLDCCPRGQQIGSCSPTQTGTPFMQAVQSASVGAVKRYWLSGIKTSKNAGHVSSQGTVTDMSHKQKCNENCCVRADSIHASQLPQTNLTYDGLHLPTSNLRAEHSLAAKEQCRVPIGEKSELVLDCMLIGSSQCVSASEGGDQQQER